MLAVAAESCVFLLLLLLVVVGRSYAALSSPQPWACSCVLERMIVHVCAALLGY
jgi:hypothetical protein